MSESKLSSFLAELSSVLDAEEMPESGDVGLSWGNVLSVRRHFGGRAEIKQNQFSLYKISVLGPEAGGGGELPFKSDRGDRRTF